MEQYVNIILSSNPYHFSVSGSHHTTHLPLCTYSMWVILSDNAAMTQNSLKFTFLLPVRFNIYKKTDQRWCKMSKTVTGSHYIEVSSSSQVKMCCYQFILFCHLYMKLSFSKCVHIFLSSISPYISWWRKLHVIHNFKS